MKMTGTEDMLEEAKEEQQNKTTNPKRKLNLFHIVRWVLLLPVLFCGAYIVFVPVFHIIIFLIRYANQRNPFCIIAEIIIASLLFTYGFSIIFLGSVVAPKYKKSIAYTMCVFYFLVHNTYSIAPLYDGHTFITALWLLLGGIFAAMYIPTDPSLDSERRHHPLTTLGT